MYKDPDKQREANRQAKSRQRRRDSRRQPKGMTSQGTTEGMTVVDEPSNVIPKTDISVIPEQVFPKTVKFPIHKRGKDIKCFDDLPVDIRLIINRLSDSKEEKQRRTAVAINYQHQFSP